MGKSWELKEGKVILYDTFEEGGPMLCINDCNLDIQSFDIPQYGGPPQYVGPASTVKDALEVLSKFT